MTPLTQANATSESTGHPLIGTEVGKYRLVRLVGRGGMGSVFEAVHTTIGQRAAVKVLNAAYSEEPEILQRFFLEARASSLVPHPGLVQIFDHGTMTGGRAYLLMEFLDGMSLRQRLRRQGGPLPPEEALPMARLIASALSAAHDKGIIHRDLKPENIFLVPDPAAPGGQRPKVLDFGIAKLADPSDSDSGLRTTTGALLGTPAYMSPEQCRAGPVTPRSDVYSFGVVLFQLLSGKTPFGDAASGEVYASHLYRAPPRLRSRAPGVSQDLDDLVEAMLRKDPEERPTMAQVEQALAATLAGAPVVLPAGRSARVRRVHAFLGRTPVQLGLLALVLLISGALTFWLWRGSPPRRAGVPRTPLAAPASPAVPVSPPAASSPPAAPGSPQATRPGTAAGGAEKDKTGRPKKSRAATREDDLEFQIAR